jgi:hypothetical protein
MIEQQHLIDSDLMIMARNGILMFRSGSRSIFSTMSDKTYNFCGTFEASQVKQISDLIKKSKSKKCWIKDYEATLILTNGAEDLELYFNPCQEEDCEQYRSELRTFWKKKPKRAVNIKDIIPLITRASRYVGYKHDPREQLKRVWLKNKDIVATNGHALIVLQNKTSHDFSLSAEECKHLSKMTGDVMLYETKTKVIISNKVTNIVKEKDNQEFVSYEAVIPDVSKAIRLPLGKKMISLYATKTDSLEINSKEGIVKISHDDEVQKFRSNKYPDISFKINPQLIGKEYKTLAVHHLVDSVHLFTIPHGQLVVMGMRT